MRKRNWHRERLSEVGKTGWGFRHGTPSGDAEAECCRQRRDQAEAGACARPQCAETSQWLKPLYRGELCVATWRGGLPERTVDVCFLLSDELCCALAGEQGMLLMSCMHADVGV